MDTDELDPAYRNALREAIILLGIFAVSLAYTVIYCQIYGYGRDPATVVFYAGIPDWVLWGIFAPWAACALATLWFCFFYMADDDLEPHEDHPAPPDDGEEEQIHAS